MNERHGYNAKSAVFCAPVQWLMLVFTFIAAAILNRIARSAGAPLEALATLALGSVMLVAYIAGTIAQRFRIPRIVGYLLAGFVAGPAWLRLVRGPELDALSPIANGALTLIAFAVGNQLTVDALRVRDEHRTALLRILTGVVTTPFLAVALVVLTVAPWFPLTAHQPFRDCVVVALSLGTMAVVSAPTLLWPVITEAGSGNRSLAETTLQVSVLQDIVAVLLVVVVLAVALPLGSGGAVAPGSATQGLLIVAGSLVAGMTLALAATQYLRVIQDRVAWVLVILALVVSQVVRLLGLDAVLIGLAAGCTLRAVAPTQSARVRDELERCAIPVYVVFFALAGSSLQLDALNEIWPWALLVMGLRVVGLWGGLRWAGRHSAVSAEWVEYGWLGLVSQGGLAVTLAAIFRRAFPEWNVSMEALLVAMIGVHQLAGPICFRWVLGRRAGGTSEVTREVHDRPMPRTNEEPAAPIAVDGGLGSRVQ
jgi:Kef-type K+ transport system membrane component KefB